MGSRGFDPTSRAGPQRSHQSIQGLFRGAGTALEYRGWGELRIGDFEITGQGLEERGGVFAPARPAQVDLSQAAHPVAVEERLQRDVDRGW
jgi:hypothetical protein